MRSDDAKRMAEILLREHDLASKGWVFEWNRAKRRLGVCKHREKVIGLSYPITVANDESGVRNTLLHEIAHAILGPGCGHGPLWKAKHRKLGGDGKRETILHTAIEAAIPINHSKVYDYMCPSCKNVRHYYRRLKRGHACVPCCTAHSGGRYDPRFRLINVELINELAKKPDIIARIEASMRGES